jgi:hypothetical protein
MIWSTVDLQKVNNDAGLHTVPLNERKTIHVSVMTAGMFEATDASGFTEGKGNTGNTEIKLAAGLFTGNDGFVPDLLVFMKPEGLNAKAFDKGQSLIGEAAAKQLHAITSAFKEKYAVPDDTEVMYDMTGYSDGSTTILSTAKAIHEQKYGKIRRVLSIGGAGFVGAQSGEHARPFQFLFQAIKEIRQAEQAMKRYGPIDRERQGVQRDGKVVVPDIHISPQAIVKNSPRLTKYSPDYEPLPVQKGGIGSENIVPLDDVKNILKWSTRLVRTALGTGHEGYAVPWRRIKESCTRNEDRAYLAQHAIPTMVFGDYKDPFFPPRLIQEDIQNLRAVYPDANIWFVTSTLGHAGPHYEQTTFSWLTEMLQKSWDRRMKTVNAGASK